MQFTDAAIVLSVRKFDEHGGVVRFLTAGHGMYAGADKFALSSRRRGLYQPGNEVQATWKARLAEHLGTVSAELVSPAAAHALDDPLKLSALHSACQLTEILLNEREPQPDAYRSLSGFLGSLREAESPEQFLVPYLLLELTLLKHSGFGLDLARCAATGATEGLAYVSPRSGRAVTGEAGAEYRDKLLPLPAFLGGQGGHGGDSARAALPNALLPGEALAGPCKSAISRQDLLDGLRLAGYFLDSRALAAKQAKLPDSRERMIRILQKGTSR